MYTSTPAITVFSAVSMLLLASCASDQEEAESQPANTAEEAHTESSEAPRGSAEGTDTESPSGAESGSDESPSTDEEPDGSGSDDISTLEGAERIPDDQLPADPTEMYFSAEGEEVGIVGLSSDQSVEILSAPDVSPFVDAPELGAEILGEAGPLDTLVLAGREQHLQQLDEVDAGPDGAPVMWAEVQLGEGYGWVPVSDLSYFGGTRDITAEFQDRVPAAEDPNVLAEGVAMRAAIRAETREVPEEVADGADAEISTEWTVVSTPEGSGEDFYRIDITGLRDDAGTGERLHVHMDQEGAGYQVTTIESTPLCSRGVTDDGGCT